MKKIVLSILAVSILSLNLVSASGTTDLNYVSNLKNVNYENTTGSNELSRQPQLSVVAGLVVIAVSLLTSPAWTGASGSVSEDASVYDLD